MDVRSDIDFEPHRSEPSPPSGAGEDHTADRGSAPVERRQAEEDERPKRSGWWQRRTFF